MAKRSRAKAPIAGLGLGKIKRRDVGGRPAKPVDESIMALERRCVALGIPKSPESIRNVRAPWYGCHAGRAIASLPDVETLWGAIVHMRKVILAYDRSIGAPSRNAKCMSILQPVDALEATASSPAYDDRSDQEKARAAQSAYMRLQGWLDSEKMAAGDTKRAVWDDAEHFNAGNLALGLRAVVRGIKGE